MSRWEYNGLTFDVSTTNADFVAKYEDAWDEYKKISPTGKLSERLRQSCDAIYKMFNRLYGEGTAEKLFEGKMYDLDVCIEAVDSFVNAMAESGKESNKKIASMNAKYAPKKRR